MIITVSFCQMLEVCSPIVSSTSHTELRSAINPNMVQGYQARHQDNNIGSIITMLIDDQGADIDEILTENRDQRAAECRERLEGPGLQVIDCLILIPDRLYTFTARV